MVVRASLLFRVDKIRYSFFIYVAPSFVCFGRFLFILLGPVGKGQQYHEIGRSMATIMTDEVHTTSAFHPLTSVAEAVCVVGDTIRAVTASAGKHPGLLRGSFKRTTPSGRLSLKFHCLFVYRQVLSV